MKSDRGFKLLYNVYNICMLLFICFMTVANDPFLFVLQVLSALDILQPPHVDFFQEMYPFRRRERFGSYRMSPRLALAAAT